MKLINNKFILLKKLIILALVLCQGVFIFPPQGNAQIVMSMPHPGAMVLLSEKYMPAMLAGVQIDPRNSFLFNFILDKGDTLMSVEKKEVEYKKIIKYFLASLTIPNDNLWVNLSPYEADRIIPEIFAKTEMGRDLLSQDYMLKQLTSSLMYP